MNDDGRARLAVAEAAREVERGRMGRRQFLTLCARAGFAFGAASPFACRSRTGTAPDAGAVRATAGAGSALEPGAQRQFLTEVGRSFAGTTLRVVTEDTPPSVATREIMKEEFEQLTGIHVVWEQLPLYRALATISADTARRAGTHDVFYLDQGWLGRFVDDTLDHRALLARTDLAYPDYRFDDILPTLVDGVATYRGRLMGIPYDIPIFIMMYRRDVLGELGLPVPTTMAGYLETVRAVHRARAPRVYGTTAQWTPEMIALECNMTAWLWGHGGSILGRDGRPAIADERAEAAMAYMLELGRYMPPGVTSWGWDEEAASFAEGGAGLYISWSEQFSKLDDPRWSKIVGLAEAAPCPRELALRPAADCSFGETPGVSHQGGSCLAVSRYSRHPEAAWIFLQWATSRDVTARACVLGGGGSPIRRSNYEDPRVREKAVVGVGTTRHFEVTRDAIERRMGTEPHFPGWATLSFDYSIELGKMVTRQQSIRATLARLARLTERAVAEAR
ncbi:ABC transporter substrate-binding protein [Anaeromyxobacter diazotrophicus]|uniref:ABC transporter substrate-binding protein n=1 Tax=Anaeromyxobacter diazotrophicus TaxID=2590199 RepID=A0A7I9VQU8_9BACT|nr:extracellular solute-binding protein [Anaeromyxobacter diazotrophicus]GEJ58792.1 ABC transporter substrate-binding protein [Anaeromyxobacter diazotrophicus]